MSFQNLSIFIKLENKKVNIVRQEYCGGGGSRAEGTRPPDTAGTAELSPPPPRGTGSSRALRRALAQAEE